ncbi:MAG: glycosyltransferase 87 family protein [Spirosomataceae bacterium]
MYGLIIGQQWSNVWIKRWLGVAIGFRIILLFSTPALSDDYFRFIWDGRLLAAGYNPYLYLPSDLLPSPVASKAHLTQQLFDGLNSPHYFTVYPPLNQLLFAASAWLSGGNVIWNIVLLRLWIILAEIGTIGLMIRFLPKVLKIPKNTQAPLIYALNPLVIVELTGNLHFEAVTIFFVLLAVGVFLKPFQNDKFSLASAVALALAVAVKLLPMLFLPLLLKRLGFWRWVVYCGAVGGVLLLFFAPFLSRELFLNFGKSLDLYFQKFEFNASIYYLLREVGYWLTGYNVIQTLGPLLSSITVVGVVWIAHRSGSLVHKMLLALTLYFLLATTVHPWYITTLVAFGALAGRWYPIVWSVLLPLTYVAYTYQPYHENLNLVVLEYVLVIGCLVYEEIK